MAGWGGVTAEWPFQCQLPPFEGSNWWFQIFFIFTPKFGEDSHFDEYVPNGLVQPPTSSQGFQIFRWPWAMGPSSFHTNFTPSTWICFCWWCFLRKFTLVKSPFFTTICGFFIFSNHQTSQSKINSFPALDRRIAFYSSYSPSTAPFSIITSGIQTWFVPQKLTLKLTAKAPENRPGPERKLTFQPSIFRCYVSFTEGREMIQS